MPSTQTVDRIIATSTHPVYVIDWNPPTENGSLESLPRQIKEWLGTNCPKVAVGRLVYPEGREPQVSALGSQGQRITASVFILGFNAQQADAFIADLSPSQRTLPESPDFYFVRCAPRQLGALIQWHVLRVRQRLLGRLLNFMRATTYEPTNHPKENHHDRTHLH